MQGATAAAPRQVRPPPKKGPPPTVRRIEKWRELRDWEAHQLERNPALMHGALRFLTAQRKGRLYTTVPPLLGAVQLQFRSRFTGYFLQLLMLACLERRHSHWQITHAQLAQLLGCSVPQVRKVVDEAVEEGFAQRAVMFDEPPYEGYRGRGGEEGRTLDHVQQANAYAPGPQLLLVWGNWQAWRRYYAGEGPPPPDHAQWQCPRCGAAPWGGSKLCWACQQPTRARDDLRDDPGGSCDADPVLHLLQRGRRRRPVDRRTKLEVRRVDEQALHVEQHELPPQAQQLDLGDAQNQARADGASVLQPAPADQPEATPAPADLADQVGASANAEGLKRAAVPDPSAVPAPEPAPEPAAAEGRPAGQLDAAQLAAELDQDGPGAAPLPAGAVDSTAAPGPGLNGLGAAPARPVVELDQDGPGAAPPPAGAVDSTAAPGPGLNGLGAAPARPVVELDQDGPSAVPSPAAAESSADASPPQLAAAPARRQHGIPKPSWLVPELRAAGAVPAALREVVARGELWLRLREAGRSEEEAEKAVAELREAQLRRRTTERRRP